MIKLRVEAVVKFYAVVLIALLHGPAKVVAFAFPTRPIQVKETAARAD